MDIIGYNCIRISRKNITFIKSVRLKKQYIPFKGRLAFKQYIKDKPTKWGSKVFVLADSCNTYVKNIQIYSGTGLESNNTDIGLCTKVCLDLFEGLQVSGLNLYTDNYYTSPSLYMHLYNKFGVNACGTCHVNRIGFPKRLQKLIVAIMNILAMVR